MWSLLKILFGQTSFGFEGKANRPGEPRHQSWLKRGEGVASPRARMRSTSWLLALLCVSPLATRAQVSPGDAFPSLSDANLSGGTLPDTAGHVVLVDFWASWCAPCKASFPAFARLNGDYASRGLVIVAVSVDEKPSAYSGFVKKWQPPFAALLDQEQKLVRAVKVPTMPTSYLIGRDGRVRFVHSGFHGSATEDELRKHIESVLGEKN